MRIRTILRHIGLCVHARPRLLRSYSGWTGPERCNLWRPAVHALTQINPAAPLLARAVWSLLRGVLSVSVALP
jgi:hypothetical protein